jgi:N-acyl-phosphatidylethanolamine-hydrolysing phospholipase D
MARGLLPMPHEFRRRLLLGMVATCVGANAVTTIDPAAHHRGSRFQNNYLEFEPKGIGALIEWRVAAARGGLPRPPETATARVDADLDFIRGNAGAGAAMVPAVTWIGHASTLVQAGGISILTDPIFSERASPFSFVGPKRHVPPGVALAGLPHIDAVLISHNHYDHLDAPSVRALAAQAGGPPLFIVPLGIKAWLAEAGIGNAVELDWWQSARVGAVEIVFTPAQHWSGRSLGDRMETLWGGYAVFAPEFQWFFAGDTAYSKDFADIHERFAVRHGAGRGFDVALLPIGAYEPRWFMSAQHVDPGEAVQIHRDLGAEHSIGIHWGTFELTDESLDEPPRALARAARDAGLADDAFTVLAIGATRRFTPHVRQADGSGR